MLRFVAICTLLAANASHGSADTSVGIRVETSSFEFGFLYGDHFHVAAADVHRHTRRMDEEDFLVALHLARVSGRKLDVIVEWRRDGASWEEIRHRCELEPRVFRVDLPRDHDPGPPYGRAWGHWKKRSQRPLQLTDEEVRALVVLRVLSDYTQKPAAEVLRHRREGWSPRKIAAKPGKGGDTTPARKAKSARSDAGEKPDAGKKSDAGNRSDVGTKHGKGNAKKK
jgi:hypothetical protein